MILASSRERKANYHSFFLKLDLEILFISNNMWNFNANFRWSLIPTVFEFGCVGFGLTLFGNINLSEFNDIAIIGGFLSGDDEFLF